MKNNKKKMIKNLLATTSLCAMIITGGTSSALGAANRTVDADMFNLQAGTNLDGGNPFVTGSKLTYTGNYSGQTGTFAGTITEIETANKSPLVFAINNGNNLTVNSITTAGGGNLPITLSNASTLILDGAAVYAGLGSIDGSGGAGRGTLNLTGNGLVYNGTIGATNSLKTINVNAGGNPVTLGSNINGINATNINMEAEDTLNLNGATTATSINLKKPRAELNINVASPIAAINFTDTADNTTVVNLNKTLTGSIDFAQKAGVVNVADGYRIDGGVNNTGGAGGALAAGTLSFAGDGEVTGAIGAAKEITAINLKGAAGKTVTLKDETKAAAVNFTAASVLTLEHNLFGNINFVGQDGTVNVTAGKTINGAVLNNAAGNGTLNFTAIGGVTGAIGAGGAIKEINIGAGLVTFGGAVTAQKLKLTNSNVQLNNNATIDTLTIAANTANVKIADTKTLTFTGNTTPIVLTGNHGRIVFDGNDSVLRFNTVAANPAAPAVGGDVTITLDADLDPSAVGRGKIHFDATNANITVNNVNAGVLKSLGTAGNTLKEIKISGAPDKVVTLNTKINAAAFDVLSGTADVKDASVLGSNITIGTPAVVAPPAAAISATLAIDSNGVNKNINDGKTITFVGEESTLKLTNNTATGPSTFTLVGNLISDSTAGVGANYVNGNLEINAAGKALTIAGAQTIGEAANKRFKKVTISGSKDITITPKIYAKEIEISSTGDVELGEIDSGADSILKFTDDGNTKFNKNVTVATIDFNGKNRVVVVDNGKNITGDVDSIAGAGGTLKFLGASTVDGVIGHTNALTEINVNGAGAVNLGGAAKAVKATTIKLGNAGSVLNLNGATSADTINFAAGGTINLNATLGGPAGADATINFATDGTLNVTGNRAITGTIKNTSGANDNGTLTFDNAGSVSGVVGGANRLLLIRLDGVNTKDVAFDGLVKTKALTLTGGGDAILSNGGIIDDININHDDSEVTLGAASEADAVTFGADGTLNVNHNLIGIGGGGAAVAIDFAQKAGVVNVADGKTITGTVDNTGAGAGGALAAGTLNFAGDGEVTGEIGAAKEITAINLKGAAGKTVTLKGETKAAAVNFTAASVLTLEHNLFGDINFAGQDGTVNVVNDKTINGAVLNNAAGNGTLNFAGIGAVTGAIGAGNALNLVKLEGANGSDVTFTGLVNTKTLQLTSGGDAILNAGATIDTLTIGDADSFVTIGNAQTLAFTGNVVAIDLKDNNGHIKFGTANSVLKFNTVAAGVLGAPGGDVTITLNADLNPGAPNKGKIYFNATNANITVNNGSLGVAGGNTLSEIKISGAANKLVTLNTDINTQTLTIDADANLQYTPNNDVNLYAITFDNAASSLTLKANGANRTFTLQDHVDPGGARGIVILDGSTKKLILDANAAGKTLGNGNILAQVITKGNVEITSLVTVNATAFDVANGTADVKNASVLDSNITIGTAAGVGAAVAATLAIDSNGVNKNINNGKTITFEGEDSTLKLTNNTATGPSTFTLIGNLISNSTAGVGGGAYDNGKLEINATGKALTIAGALTIGEAANKRFKKVTISGGDKEIKIAPKIYAKEIEISSTGVIELGEIDSGDGSTMIFTTDSNVNAVKFTDDVTVKTIDFDGKTRNITVDDTKKITTKKIKNGGNANITFADNGELTLEDAADTAVFKKIIAGAAGTEVKLSAGNYTGQIEFSDTGKITAADGFILTGGFNTAGGLAAGMIDFAGSATISGDLGGAGSALGAVKVAGASTLQIGGNVNVASLDGTNDGSDQNLKFTNAADIEVKGDIGAGANLKFNQIEFAGAHIVDFKNRLVANTLHFNASANVITTAFDLGGTNITAGITNAKLTVNKDQTITGAIRDFGTLHVNGDKTINLNTPDFEATITTENDDEGTINFNVNGPKVKSIGTAGEKFKIVNIRAKVIAGTHGVDGVFTETLNINANAEAILADVNADNITVNDNGKVGFFGSLTSANPIIFTNADSTAGFFDIDIDNALISHGGAGNGKIGIYGSNVNVDIGTDAASVKEVEFNDRTANVPGLVTRAISEIDANIYAQDIFVENGYELQLKKDVEFKGKTNIDEATITLGENDLKLINGDSSITTSTINTTVDRGNVGNFVAGNGANVTLNGDITIDITVTNLPANNARVVLVKKEGKEGNGRLIKGVNLKPIINTKGAFVGWKEDYTDNEFALIFQDKTAEVISSDLASIGASSDTTAENSQAIEDAIDGTEGEQIQSLFNSISDTSERADAIVRLVDNLSDNASAVSVVNVDLAIESISSRLSDNFVIPLDSSVFNFTPDTPDIGSSTPSSSLPPQIVDSVGNAAPANAAPANATPANATSTGSTTQAGGANASKPAATTPQKANTNTTGPNDGKARTQRKVSSEEIIYGLSAGDDAARYGVWMAPFAGNGVKKKNKSTSGYKSTSVGGTFGFDTKVNDNMVLGLAVTALNSRVNHKDFKKGDKTKIDTTLFSAYASIDMGNNWFSQNIASIGSSRVENKENRRVSRAAGYQIAKGKYSTMHFALESTAGFNKLINNQVVLTPSVGVGYSRINDTSYTETGNVGPQALTITKKAAQKLELIGGLRLTGLPFMVNEMYVTPEVHASVRHDVIGKNPTTFSKVNGLRDLKEKSKPTKTHYGVGGGLKFSYNMMDYGVYADTTYAKKYVGVNGSVNVRVNF